MSRTQAHGHGTWQLEELLRAFEAVITTLPTENADGMSAKQVNGLYFLLQQLVRRLEDIFYVIVHEQCAVPDEHPTLND